MLHEFLFPVAFAHPAAPLFSDCYIPFQHLKKSYRRRSALAPISRFGKDSEAAVPMSVFVNCSCGSQFEVEETFAGQTVSCPECRNSVRVPAVTRRPLRTSTYALASVLLGVTLAFTVVGTIVAVILGCVGLVSIARNRGRVTGAGYAVFGIVWGVIFTGVTLMALTRGELFGLDQLRQQILAGEVDLTGPMEVIREKDGFAITRPSGRWGVARESLLQRLNPNGSLLLANV